MKRVFILITTLAIAACTNGCSSTFLPERVEIDKLNFISAVGVDKGFKDPENICITVISKLREEGQSSNSGALNGREKAIILSNEAKTILESERELQTYSDKQMFWGHIEFFLISEEAAKEGIAKYIDFLARDHEMRDTSKIYIIKGTTAKNFVEQSSAGEYYMPDRLKAIGENSKLFSGSQELEILEFMQWLNNKYSSAVAPVLYLKPVEKGNQKEEQPCMDIELNGYAIFKGLKLITILDREQTRGENFLLNRVVTGVVEVKSPDGAMIGLEIINNHTDIHPVFQNGELQEMQVKVKLTSNVDEVHSTEKIFTKDTLAFLAEEQSRVVKAEIEKVIETAQKKHADFIDMANVFGTKHPVRWEKYKDRWEEIFPELPIQVTVESKINRTYDIREPNGFYEEEHK